MGLLGNSWDDPQSQAVMALAGGLLSGNFGQGAKDYGSVLAGAKDADLKRQFLKAQLDDAASQASLRAEQANQIKAKAAQEQRVRSLIQSAGQVQPGMGATDQVNSALPPEMRIGALPALQQAGKIDYMALMQQGVPFDMVKDLAASKNLGREEVARVQEIEGPNGQKVLQGFDKFGRPVDQGVNGYTAPQLVNLGNRQVFAKPSAGVSMDIGQSPDSKASNALGWANFGLSKERLNMDKADPKLAWNESLGGFINPRTRQVLPALDAQGRPIEGAGAKMTEDQGKATGWLIQAENAFKNMNAVTAKNPDAARPGFNDALAAVPSMGAAGGIANMMRGADRQKFMQASSSLSEALLRAATGAGVNKDEAAQKIKELTPQVGDDAETIAQKNASIPLYIESLKVRAGAGAKKASSIMSNAGGATGGWAIQKVD